MNIIEFIEEKVNQTKLAGRYRNYISLERKATIKPWALEHIENEARKINVWCSNDYLAMSQHSEVVTAVVDSAMNVGLGTGGARSISGTSIYHTELELEISNLYRKESALLFITGFTANDATLSTICNLVPEMVVFSDGLNHASIINGIRYSKAEKNI